MIVSRPFYAARIAGAPDIPVAVRADSGRYVIDSGRAPLVEGNVTLAIPDVAILEDLDPRDGRRLIVDVYPDSHYSPVYSAWSEKRRNLIPVPTPTVYAGSGWNASGGSIVEPGWVGATINTATTGYIFTDGAEEAIVAGDILTITISYRVDVIGTGAATHVRVVAHRRTTNAYYTPPQIVRPIVIGQLETVTLQWTAPVDIPAGDLDIAVTTAQAPGNFAAVSGGFTWRAGRALIERGATVGDYFDGSTNPAGELTRTRWTAGANMSPSIVETRSVVDLEHVPDGMPRTFDLGIREPTPARGAGTAQLQLASDEALLDDFAQLVDDNGARAHETSLRAVVDYVLAKIGASLEPGDEDADVTAYWAITNLLSNPSLELNADGWLPGTGASALARVSNSTIGSGAWALRWTAAAGASNVVPAASSNSFHTVKPGEWYVFAFSIASASAGGRQARAAIQWWSQGGSVPSATSEGALGLSIPAASTRMYVIAQCPPGADRAVPFVNTIGNTGGEFHYVDSAMFYAGDELVPYFDGSTPDSALYTYDWQATPNASTSTRKPTIDRPPAALKMKAGVSGLAFLVPLIQAAGFRLLCNERREWTLRSTHYREAGAQAFREGVNVIDATEKLSRSSDEWFDGVVFVYTWTDDDGIEQIRTDAFALPGATKVISREIRAPFPGPGRAQYAVTRAQGRGRTVTATKQADWTETADQAFTALLTGTPIQIGTANRVEFDIGENTVTTTSRTTDTPAGAIVLLTGTILALSGTINEL